MSRKGRDRCLASTLWYRRKRSISGTHVHSGVLICRFASWATAPPESSASHLLTEVCSWLDCFPDPPTNELDHEQMREIIKCCAQVYPAQAYRNSKHVVEPGRTGSIKPPFLPFRSSEVCTLYPLYLFKSKSET